MKKAGEAVRYLQSNTQDETYLSILKQLKHKLIERGYKSESMLREYPFTREKLVTLLNHRPKLYLPNMDHFEKRPDK